MLRRTILLSIVAPHARAGEILPRGQAAFAARPPFGLCARTSSTQTPHARGVRKSPRQNRRGLKILENTRRYGTCAFAAVLARSHAAPPQRLCAVAACLGRVEEITRILMMEAYFTLAPFVKTPNRKRKRQSPAAAERHGVRTERRAIS